MKALNSWSDRVVGIGVVMAAFAYPHLIDDFLYGIPEEFGLSDPQAQVLVGFFTALLFILMTAAARRVRWAYAGMGFLGGFLSLAIILKHVPAMLRPEPYWSGEFSESLNWGLLVTSFILMVVSFVAFSREPQKVGK
jgi:hypothetical protein